MSKNVFKAATLAVAMLNASAAHATTYIDNHTAAGATVSLSVTTNGALGMLTTDDITAFDISVTSGSNAISLISGVNNASVLLFGGALTATPTDLIFNFSSPNSFLAFYRTGGDHYCFETAGGCGGGSNSESFRFGTDPFQTVQRFSSQTVASVAVTSPVPEPETWILMLAGFAAVGGAMRSRRRQTKTSYSMA